MVQVEIDVSTVKQVLAALSSDNKQLMKAYHRGLAKSAVLVLKDAKRRCPVETGILRSSGYAAWPTGGKNVGDDIEFSNARGTSEELTAHHGEITAEALERAAEGLTIVVGFSAPYAVFVHERTELNHPRGEAKFLENAVITNRGEVEATIAHEIDKAIEE